jgi:hypothetical protein
MWTPLVTLHMSIWYHNSCQTRVRTLGVRELHLSYISLNGMCYQLSLSKPLVLCSPIGKSSWVGAKDWGCKVCQPPLLTCLENTNFYSHNHWTWQINVSPHLKQQTRLLIWWNPTFLHGNSDSISRGFPGWRTRKRLEALATSVYSAMLLLMG